MFVLLNNIFFFDFIIIIIIKIILLCFLDFMFLSLYFQTVSEKNINIKLNVKSKNFFHENIKTKFIKKQKLLVLAEHGFI